MCLLVQSWHVGIFVYVNVHFCRDPSGHIRGLNILIYNVMIWRMMRNRPVGQAAHFGTPTILRSNIAVRQAVMALTAIQPSILCGCWPSPLLVVNEHLGKCCNLNAKTCDNLRRRKCENADLVFPGSLHFSDAKRFITFISCAFRYATSNRWAVVSQVLWIYLASYHYLFVSLFVNVSFVQEPQCSLSPKMYVYVSEVRKFTLRNVLSNADHKRTTRLWIRLTWEIRRIIYSRPCRTIHFVENVRLLCWLSLSLKLTAGTVKNSILIRMSVKVIGS